MNISTSAPAGMFGSLVSDLQRNWGWLLALGILLVILGLAAIADSVATTLFSMLFLGWILVVAGVVEAIQAFRHRTGGHLFLHALDAVLSLVLGAMLLRSPVAGALVFTLLLAMYFVVVAIFRIVMSFSMRPVHGWAWVLLEGIVTLILGILIWAQWPVSGLWVIGLFIGIHLLVVGWSQIMIALAVRRLPAP